MYTLPLVNRNVPEEMEKEHEPYPKLSLNRARHKVRRQAPICVAGLIDPGDREIGQPLAEWLAAGNRINRTFWGCRCLVGGMRRPGGLVFTALAGSSLRRPRG
jgi:hypothetical protein